MINTLETLQNNNVELNDEMAEKYLTFRLGNQHYGFSINYVIEIVQMQEPTIIPELPYYTKGIINLRGRVVPLIDVNLRFGKPEEAYTDRTCIIIVDVDKIHAGFIVDKVEDVLNIPADSISAPPSVGSDLSARYITGIGKMQEHMVLLLNPRLLINDDDMSIIGAVAQ